MITTKSTIVFDWLLTNFPANQMAHLKHEGTKRAAEMIRQGSTSGEVNFLLIDDKNVEWVCIAHWTLK